MNDTLFLSERFLLADAGCPTHYITWYYCMELLYGWFQR